MFKNGKLKITGLSKDLAQELAALIQGDVLTETEAQFKYRRSLKHIPGLFNILIG